MKTLLKFSMHLLSLTALSFLIFIAGTAEKIGRKTPELKGKTIAGGLLGLGTAFADVPDDSSPIYDSSSDDDDCDEDEDEDEDEDDC